jgi:hypothetical protein
MAANSMTLAQAGVNGLHENHSAFLKRLADREVDDRAARQWKLLSAEQHASHQVQLSTVRL